MNNQIINRLLIVFFVLILLILGRWFWQQKQSQKTDDLEKTIQKINTESISKITISSQDKNIELIKKDQKWFIDDQPANATNASQLIGDLANGKSENIAKTNKLHENFGLKDDQGILVNLYEKEKEILSIILGKKSSLGVYVRFKDKDLVYLLKPFGKLPSIKVEDWQVKSN